jgi:hypothetical protein
MRQPAPRDIIDPRWCPCPRHPMGDWVNRRTFTRHQKEALNASRSQLGNQHTGDVKYSTQDSMMDRTDWDETPDFGDTEMDVDIPIISQEQKSQEGQEDCQKGEERFQEVLQMMKEELETTWQAHQDWLDQEMFEEGEQEEQIADETNSILD